MTTSGVTGTATLDVMSWIEHAARRCGASATVLTGENLRSAVDNLGLILSNFSNKGMQLWCTTKTVYPIAEGAAYTSLNIGTTGVLNVNLRTVVTDTTGQSITPGSVTYTPTAGATLVSSVTLTVPAGSYVFVLQSAPDNATWTQNGILNLPNFSGGSFSFDSDLLISQPYWRVLETLAGTVVATYAAFLNTPSELPAAKISRDAFVNMTNKTYSAIQPLQYWFDRQATNPRVWYWPVPQDGLHQLVVWGQRLIQDVGTFTDTIDCPQRWVDAGIFELAKRVFLELPKELVDPTRYAILREEAQLALGDAMDAEVDGAPVRLTPNIRGYTA